MSRQVNNSMEVHAMADIPLEPAIPAPPNAAMDCATRLKAKQKQHVAPLKLDKAGGNIKLAETSANPLLLELQKHMATGVIDHDAQMRIIDSLCRGVPDDQINGVVALATELKPRDAIEGMLISQMIRTFLTASNHVSRSNNDTGTLRQGEYDAKVASKMMRLYLEQMQALTKYRQKGTQRIVVQHQQVNIAPGAQAVVGDINQGGTGNGS